MNVTVEYQGAIFTVANNTEAADLFARLKNGGERMESVPHKERTRQADPPKAEKAARVDLFGGDDVKGRSALRLLYLVRDAGKDGVSTRRLVVEFGFKDQRGLGPLANILIARMNKVGFSIGRVYTKRSDSEGVFYVPGEEIVPAIRALEAYLKMKAA
jgi:hypothetical protein